MASVNIQAMLLEDIKDSPRDMADARGSSSLLYPQHCWLSSQ
ncbi:hypothetical protein CK203_063420 [Vitis vinifera]|uniref:Uncharacterized protein n=1 Tax=Vitis vinifera TaxID=29760 RepID=A0A438G8G3_VITVI|nr:hypothetical protein CK203_063420 [Vitis vinifera]